MRKGGNGLILSDEALFGFKAVFLSITIIFLQRVRVRGCIFVCFCVFLCVFRVFLLFSLFSLFSLFCCCFCCVVLPSNPIFTSYINQSAWRGYVARCWYLNLRETLPPKDEKLRKAFFEKKLHQITDRLLKSVNYDVNR